MHEIPWYSFDWLTKSTFLGFDWEEPAFLKYIPFILLLFFIRWLLHFKYRQKLEVAFQKGFSPFSFVSLLRFIPDLILCFFLGFLLISLARPQKTNEQVDRYSEGIDIMLILDTSGSMKLEDFIPNRVEAAKDVARNFIKGRFQDRIGLVVFAGESYSLAPLTTDYKLLQTLINDIKLGMIPIDGTAIGSALAVAINRMKESKNKSKVFILLSDGENNAGNIDPNTAAEMANGLGIKIYTIGVGKDGQVPFGKNFFGQTQYVESMLDETNLKDIAKIGDGKFFRATDKNTLVDIFKRIDTYEKAEIKETRFKDTKDFYPVYLKWSVSFFLLWLFFKNTFVNNILED